MMEPTADRDVFIEEKRPGYVRYWRKTDGRRWIVKGTCDRRGDCLIGAAIANEHNESEIVRSHEHIEELKRRLGRERIDSEMDVPVSPEFGVCCGLDRFEYVVLDSGEASGD